MNSVAVPNRREDLVRAFLDTEYLVFIADDPCTVRIGRAHPPVDRQTANQPWAIVTAYNPDAVGQSRIDNRRRHERLVDRVKAAGLETSPACNRDPSGRWPDEPGLLLHPCPVETARHLALEFGQAGFVASRPGMPAGLWLIGDGWPARLPEHCQRIAG